MKKSFVSLFYICKNKFLITISLASSIILIGIASGAFILNTSAEDGNARVYVIQEGDSLSSISRKSGIAVSELLKANNLKEDSVIVYGDELVIPNSVHNSAQNLLLGSDKKPVIKNMDLNNTTNQEASTDTNSSIELSDAVPTTMVNPSKITVDFNNADIRDVLSSLAVCMNTSILFADQPKMVSLHVENMTPMTALELLLQKEGLSYIKNGSIIVVGKSDALLKDFFDKMVITRFDLSHITAQKISEQLDKLEIVLKKIVLDENPNAIWVQGSPQAISKVSELVNALDRAENVNQDVTLNPYKLSFIKADTLVSITNQLGIGVRAITVNSNQNMIWVQGSKEDIRKFENLLKLMDVKENKITTDSIMQINLKYLTSDKIEPIINQMGIPVRIITIESNTETFWVMGAAQALTEVQDIVKQLDIVENYSMSELDAIREIKLKYISASKISTIIDAADIDIKILSTDTNPYTIWLQGKDADVEATENLIATVDVEMNRSDLVFFAFNFNNITADQAVEGLSALNLSDVKTIVTSPLVAKSILVICPKSMENTVKGSLFNLDMELNKIANNAAKVKVPVDYASDSTALGNRRDLIISLTGVNYSSFRISQNISRSGAGSPTYVLWLEDTQGNVKKVQDAIKMIDAPLNPATHVSGYTP